MADLARMQNDKQIWLTRSHLAALAMLTLFIALLSFFIGLQLGQQRSQAPIQADAPQLLPDPAREDALEALLRQVEAAQAVDANAQDLTFPQALSAGEMPSTPLASAEGMTGQLSAVAPPPNLSPPSPQSIPPLPIKEGWSIQAFSFEDITEATEKVSYLNEAGWTAYQVAALVNGENWHRVRVGGYPSKEEATAAAAELSSSLGLEDLMIARAP